MSGFTSWRTLLRNHPPPSQHTVPPWLPTYEFIYVPICLFFWLTECSQKRTSATSLQHPLPPSSACSTTFIAPVALALLFSVALRDATVLHYDLRHCYLYYCSVEVSSV